MGATSSYTSKKATSKLHKLTSYKSNYTSTRYMNVSTSLCWRLQTTKKSRQSWHGDFFTEVHLVATKLSPRWDNAAGPLATGDPQVTLFDVEYLPQALALHPIRPIVALRVLLY